MGVEQKGENGALWRPDIPDYEPPVSLIESQGGLARAVWAEKFRSLAEIVRTSSLVLGTDIGGGLAVDNIAWSVDGATGMKIYGDGLKVPPYYDLEARFGAVPRALFLIASTRTPDDMVSLYGVANEYRKQGVGSIYAFLSAFPHERQDHHFTDKQGNPILQAETLQTMIMMMARSRLIDGLLVLQPHSMQPVRNGLLEGLTMLPIDASNYMLEKSGVREVRNPFVVGPDKGRRNVAKWLASKLQCPYGVCEKSRARTTNGLPTVDISTDILRYIKENDCTVVIMDDEIREGGTSAALRQTFAGWARRWYMYAVKGFFAPMNGSTLTAADALALPLAANGRGFEYDEEQIVVTDAVTPLGSVQPIANKLKVLRLRPEVDRLMAFLQEHFVPRQGEADWLRNEVLMGTQLRLDLMKETYE